MAIAIVLICLGVLLIIITWRFHLGDKIADAYWGYVRGEDIALLDDRIWYNRLAKNWACKKGTRRFIYYMGLYAAATIFFMANGINYIINEEWLIPPLFVLILSVSSLILGLIPILISKVRSTKKGRA